MRKICLVVVGLYLHLLSAFSQTTADSAKYKIRKLTTDEVNFVQSYYTQEGNHSAVTGGIGMQKLADYSSVVDVDLYKYNKRMRKVALDIDFAVDDYTSASSDKIDPNTISSASASDIHLYPSGTLTITNEQTGAIHDYAASYSIESDYFSYGFGGGFGKQSKDRNRIFTANAKLYLDQVRIILPYELRNLTTGGIYGAPNEHIYPYKSRNTLTTSYTLSQVINKRLQVLFLLDIAYQQGYLALPFHRIYFNNGSETIENLPQERFKIPVGVRASYFIGDQFILRSYYRFYHDDWGLNAHTIDNELVIKCSPFFSVAPFYRYYTQNAIDYFAPYEVHTPTEKYYSSDYDLSAFHSSFFGAGIRLTPLKGIFGNPEWTMAELRYGYYTRTDGFYANSISLDFKFK
jgi:Protein of unknown function (DUF3570)